MSKKEERKIKKQTNNWLKEMGPTIHLSLFTHHEVTRKANEIEEPTDDTIITFEFHYGEYNIRYGKLKELAEEEKKKFIDDYKHTDNKRTE